MRKIIVLLAMIFSINLKAQDTKTPLSKLIDQSRESKSNELSNLQGIDLKVISSIPTKRDYKMLFEKITSLSRDEIRCIDSIDYSHSKNNDSIIIKIYSQDYAYRSNNCYKLGLNNKIQNDSLSVYNVCYDMKMKSIIEDYSLFKEREFKYRIIKKRVGDNHNIDRIVLLKAYLN
jgi:hypothetical protein